MLSILLAIIIVLLLNAIIKWLMIAKVYLFLIFTKRNNVSVITSATSIFKYAFYNLKVLFLKIFVIS